MWNYSSCEVQGRGHISKDIPCQDKTKTSFCNGTYVIALADGAGSAKLSHHGAACVVDSITDLFTGQFESLFCEKDGRQVKKSIIEKMLNDINVLSEQLSCTPKDLAATMLAVAVNDDRFIIAHIGDGVIGYLDGVDLKVASAPSNGEHVNETYFVTSKDAINTMKLFKGDVKNIAGFVIMSDGTEQSLYNKRNNSISPAVIKLLQRNIILDEQAMRSQLESTFNNVIITRTHDDCSIAILSHENESLRTLEKLTYAEKCDLFGICISSRMADKRVSRYDLILDVLQQPANVVDVSRKIHLKTKYTRRHLEFLRSLGLVKFEKGMYKV